MGWDGYIIKNDINVNYLIFIMNLLNEEQKYALKCVSEGNNILLTGSAGTGKSYTIKYIIEYLNNANKKYAITASTGTAAVIIGGQTLHSFLGLGLGTGTVKEILNNILKNKKKHESILNLEVLIIDEISMIDKDLFEKISLILSIIKSNDVYFGNIQIILVGDFCQLAPVKGKYCFLADIWNKMNIKIVLLEKLIRHDEDLLFQQILKIVRKGRCTDNIIKVLNKLKDTEFENGIIPTKLYPINVNVDKINNIEIEKLKACGNISKTYTAISSSDKEKEVGKFTIELTLNAQIIIIRNINVEESLVNGTRGIVKHLGNDFVVINDINGNIHTIKYFTDTFNNSISSKSSYIIHMPIRICYALSIHKSQGMTIDALELDLGPNIFTCGQSYTALSRARKLSSIKIIDIDKDSFRTNIDVKNFYKDCNK
jgi:ATP-dependent DNA helicase PIF1